MISNQGHSKRRRRSKSANPRPDPWTVFAPKITYDQAQARYFIAGGERVITVGESSAAEFEQLVEAAITGSSSGCPKRVLKNAVSGLEYGSRVDRWYTIIELQRLGEELPLFATLVEAKRALERGRAAK